MDGVHFAAVPAPSLADALPADWGTETSASQHRARLRGCVHHSLRHDPDPLGRGSRGHPHPLRLPDCRAAAAGALPRDADERLPLFPLGLTLSNALPRKWHRWGRIILTTLVGCALSAGIEYTQYRYALGLAETDDVICNTLGAFIGTTSLLIAHAIENPEKGFGTRT